MTRTGEPWPDLHDAILESIELAWSSGEARILLTTADPKQSRRAIVAASVCRLDYPRHHPWGSSASINQVRGPALAGAHSLLLEIEMQSGDTIRIQAAAFSFDSLPASRVREE